MSGDYPAVARWLVSQTQDDQSQTSDDDDECSDFSSSEKPPPKKIPKLGGRLWWCLNINSKGKSYYPARGAPTNVKTALWELAGREFGGNPANGVYFLNGDSRSTKAHAVQGYRCSAEKPATRFFIGGFVFQTQISNLFDTMLSGDNG